MTPDTHRKRGALKMLLRMGVYLNACLFEHTQVRGSPDVIPVLLTLK